MTLGTLQFDTHQLSSPSESDSLPPLERTGFYRSKSKGPGSSDESLEVDTSRTGQLAPADNATILNKSMFNKNVQLSSTMIGGGHTETKVHVQEILEATILPVEKKADEHSLSRAFRQFVGMSSALDMHSVRDMDLDEQTLLGATGRSATARTVVMEDSERVALPSALGHQSSKTGTFGDQMMSIARSPAGLSDSVTKNPRDGKSLHYKSSDCGKGMCGVVASDTRDAAFTGRSAEASSVSGSFRHLDEFFSPKKPTSALHSADSSKSHGLSEPKKREKSMISLLVQEGELKVQEDSPLVEIVEKDGTKAANSGSKLTVPGSAQPVNVSMAHIDKTLVLPEKSPGGSRSISRSATSARVQHVDVEKCESIRHVGEVAKIQYDPVMHSRAVLRPLENLEALVALTEGVQINGIIEKQDRTATSQSSMLEKAVDTKVQVEKCSTAKSVASTSKSASSGKIASSTTTPSSVVLRKDIEGIFSDKSFEAFASFFEVSQVPEFRSLPSDDSTVTLSQPDCQQDESMVAPDIPEFPTEVVELSNLADVTAELNLTANVDVDLIMDRVDDLDLRHTLYWSISEEQHKHEVAAFNNERIVFSLMEGNMLVYVELAERIRKPGKRELFTNADGVKARRNTNRIYNVWFHSTPPDILDYTHIHKLVHDTFLKRVSGADVLRRYPTTDNLGKMLEELSLEAGKLKPFLDDVLAAIGKRRHYELKDSVLTVFFLCGYKLLCFALVFKIDLDTYPNEPIVPFVRNHPRYFGQMP
ncbi:unnamed protein product [Ixodes hexagonus]